MQTLEVAE